ncbi:cyclin A isoform X2 [Rhodnius prolixus]|uniref:cyclin A isoform X2 n=1 Tax=Rhodnius prolixus TaxID=13249 RepID=UPI003D1881F6
MIRAMASFAIHQDEENNVPKFCKAKEALRNVQKRAVLGTININHESTNFNSQGDLVLKKDAVDASAVSSKASCCPPAENKPCKSLTVEEKKTEISNKLTKEVVGRGLENTRNGRTPLKEIKENERTSLKHQSPMSVDASPKVSASVSLSRNIYAISVDPLYVCPPYNLDIYNYLKTLETQFKAKAYYMKRQPDVTYAMRTILVDWLVEVGEEYRLHNETLFMAVSLIDRFLSSMAVVRTKLQLLGTSAMFIAAKYEEIYPPEASEFTYITDDTYTKKQLLRMEHLVLKVLSFDLSSPTAYTFISHISAVYRIPEKVTFLAMYIAELSLLEGDPYLEYAPSALACASLILANHCLEQTDIWPQAIAKSTGYSLRTLGQLIAHLSDTHAKSFTAQQQASRDKYSRDKYHYSSQVPAKRLVIRDQSGTS